ncbi:MAG: D-glycero-beta-D-manno-heptose 1-phosphate adenylyltransferase [Proteobacteria bacterium]|nr:D-glycero-beta-D-manno-heptose 1-phosphate adenylyltransferase [Pseudomonadota bacterium]
MRPRSHPGEGRGRGCFNDGPGGLRSRPAARDCTDFPRITRRRGFVKRKERDGMKKILSWEALKVEVERRRQQGEKIAFTNGCFDILHVGHVRYLREARKRGDLLILALNSDVSARAIKGERRPLLPEQERAEVVASLEAVDYVTLFDETTPLRLIEYLRPDVLVKGGDWNEEAVVGRDAVRSWGGEVLLVPVVEGASTTNIVEKVLRAYGRQ